MDNKKLLHILLKDVVDLEDLILSLKSTGTSDPLDFELIYTKVTGVRHLLEVMGQREDQLVQPEKKQVSNQSLVDKVSPDSGRPVSGFMNTQIEEVAEDIHPEVRQSHPEEKKLSAPPVQEPKPEPVSLPESMPELQSEPVSSPEVNPEPQPEPEVEHVQLTMHDTTGAADDGDEVELEEVAASGKQTLGERFVQGRSVNDLLLEQSKSESKFSNLPVSSLQAAIGINDKFLFTRELFDGNAKAFSEVIRKLDDMTGIHEAAVYLRENFKWKKTETSLKFIDLVKRRFM